MGASSREAFNILRTLYRELRPTVNAPQRHVYETQLWKHIVGLCRSSNTQPVIKMQEVRKNLEETGRMYVFYLQSAKEYHRISDAYKGAGERTAEETAKLLGFKMPNEPRDQITEKDRCQSTPLSANETPLHQFKSKRHKEAHQSSSPAPPLDLRDCSPIR